MRKRIKLLITLALTLMLWLAWGITSFATELEDADCYPVSFKGKYANTSGQGVAYTFKNPGNTIIVPITYSKYSNHPNPYIMLHDGTGKVLKSWKMEDAAADVMSCYEAYGPDVNGKVVAYIEVPFTDINTYVYIAYNEDGPQSTVSTAVGNHSNLMKFRIVKVGPASKEEPYGTVTAEDTEMIAAGMKVGDKYYRFIDTYEHGQYVRTISSRNDLSYKNHQRAVRYRCGSYLICGFNKCYVNNRDTRGRVYPYGMNSSVGWDYTKYRENKLIKISDMGYRVKSNRSEGRHEDDPTDEWMTELDVWAYHPDDNHDGLCDGCNKPTDGENLIDHVHDFKKVYYSENGIDNAYYYEECECGVKKDNIKHYTQFTIKWDLNGGTISPAVSDKTINAGSSVTMPNSVVNKTGYTFLGWSETKNGTVVASKGESITPKKSTTYYAAYKKNPYVIKWDLNGGTASSTISAKTIEADTSLTMPTVTVTRTGYDFLGWSTTKNGTVVAQNGDTVTPSGSTTYYAVWKKKPYLIKWDLNGGTSSLPINDKTIEADTSLTMPTTTITKTGHDFMGWSTTRNGTVVAKNGDTVTPSGNTTYYAVFKAKQFKVSFTGVDGSVIKIDVTYGQPFGILPEIPYGYKWVKSDTGEEITSTLVYTWTEAITVKVESTIKQYYVTFVSDTKSQIIEVNQGETVTAPFTPSKTGYTFKWWSTSRTGSAFNFNTAINENKTLYAVFEGKTITVTFPGYGSKQYQVPATFGELPTLSQSGSKFVGWYWDDTLTRQLKPTENVPMYNITVYAKFESIKYDVEIPGSGPISIGQYDPWPDLPTPSESGKEFDGWYVGDKKIEPGDSYEWDYPVTVTPKWKDKIHHVTLPDGETRTVKEGDLIGQFNPPRTDMGTSITGYEDQNGNSVDKDTRVYGDLIIKPVVERGTVVLSLYDDGSLYRDVVVQAGLKVTDLPTLQKPGYKFIGWSQMESGKVTTGPFLLDTTLYSRYTAENQVIVLEEAGQTIKRPTGSDLGSLPTLEKEGYDFTGWYYNGEKVTADTKVPAGGMALTPGWEKVEIDSTAFVTIRFWSDDIRINTIDKHPGEVFYDPGPPALEILQERVFAYWATSDGKQYTFGKRISQDLDLYAVWQ